MIWWLRLKLKTSENTPKIQLSAIDEIPSVSKLVNVISERGSLLKGLKKSQESPWMSCKPLHHCRDDICAGSQWLRLLGKFPSSGSHRFPLKTTMPKPLKRLWTTGALQRSILSFMSHFQWFLSCFRPQIHCRRLETSSHSHFLKFTAHCKARSKSLRPFSRCWDHSDSVFHWFIDPLALRFEPVNVFSRSGTLLSTSKTYRDFLEGKR